MTVWAEVLPLAIGIALSPIPLMLVIMVLVFSTRPRVTATGFLVGWVAGIAITAGIFALLASRIETGDEPTTWASWVRVVLGAALLALGARTWLRRSSGESSDWLRSLGDVSPPRAAGVAFMLSALNPKNLLLGAGAGLAIGSAELPPGQTVGVLVVFTAIAALDVVVPIVLHVLMGDRILGPLRAARDWLEKRGAVVLTLVLGVIGALVFVEGVTGLL